MSGSLCQCLRGYLDTFREQVHPPPLIFFILKDFDIFRALQPVFGGRGGHM